MNDTDTPYMKVTEFARFFRLGKTTVYTAIRDGQIAAITVGRNVRIPRTEIDRLMREGGIA